MKIWDWLLAACWAVSAFECSPSIINQECGSPGCRHRRHQFHCFIHSLCLITILLHIKFCVCGGVFFRVWGGGDYCKSRWAAGSSEREKGKIERRAGCDKDEINKEKGWERGKEVWGVGVGRWKLWGKWEHPRKRLRVMIGKTQGETEEDGQHN